MSGKLLTGDSWSKERNSNDVLHTLTPRDKTEVVLPACLKEFEEVCLEKEVAELPPVRDGSLKDSNLQLPFLRIYHLSNHEEVELRKWVD